MTINPFQHNDPYSLLLQWLQHHGSRSYQQIASVCKYLQKEKTTYQFSDHKEIFEALFRTGLVEFAGDGRFGLSSPTGIIYGNQSVCCVMNPNKEQRRYLYANYQVEEPVYNILKLHYSSHRQLIQLQNDGIKIIRPVIEYILNSFPSVKAVITNMPTTYLNQNYYLWFDISTRTWIEKQRSDIIGLCKGDKYATSYFFQDQDGNVYKIASKAYNPDLFNIALCYQASFSTVKYLNYDATDHRLHVTLIRLPAVLERVVRMPELYTICSQTISEHQTFKRLSSTSFTIIQNILNITA